jgi:hypothetical protein
MGVGGTRVRVCVQVNWPCIASTSAIESMSVHVHVVSACVCVCVRACACDGCVTHWHIAGSFSVDPPQSTLAQSSFPYVTLQARAPMVVVDMVRSHGHTSIQRPQPHTHTLDCTHTCIRARTVLECLIRIKNCRFQIFFFVSVYVNLMILYARRPGYVKFASDATARLKFVSPAALRHPG